MANGNPLKGPKHLAALIGAHVKAGIEILIWLIMAAGVCTAAYIGIRCLIWVARLATSAMGS